MKPIEILLMTCVSFLVTLAAMPVASRAAVRLRIVSSRSPNCRPGLTDIPLFGGVAMALGIGSTLAIFGSGGMEGGGIVAVGAFAALALGLVDDIRPLTPAAKLLGQIAIALVIVQDDSFMVVGDVTERFAAGFWIVLLMNSINLLDALDGTAAGTVGIILLFSLPFLDGGGYATGILVGGVIGAVAAFLIHNFPPARSYMGDAGTMLLGYAVAVITLSIQAPSGTGGGEWSVIETFLVRGLIVGVPILDTAFLTITRPLRGVPPWKGGHDHLIHRIMRAGMREADVVRLLYGANLVSGCLAHVAAGLLWV